MAEAIDVYRDAFVARGRHELDSEPVVLNGPGVSGVAFVRVLVVDDSGYERLAGEIAGSWQGVVFVFDRAVRCTEFMRGQPGWSAHSELAMVLHDVNALVDMPLPDGLLFRPVHRVATDPSGAVPLRDAAVAAVAADPGITESPEEIAGYLGRLPPAVRLFAAVDESGTIRATAACHVFGEYTQIFFVGTQPAWRRRGIGQAMTTGALRAAAALGAHKAFLHATTGGTSIYRQLGFEEAGLVTRYSRSS